VSTVFILTKFEYCPLSWPKKCTTRVAFPRSTWSRRQIQAEATT